MDSVKEEKVCRICHEEDGEMISPCLCIGSLEFVHNRCLLGWTAEKEQEKCEVCDGYYYFRPGAVERHILTEAYDFSVTNCVVQVILAAIRLGLMLIGIWIALEYTIRFLLSLPCICEVTTISDAIHKSELFGGNILFAVSHTLLCNTRHIIMCPVILYLFCYLSTLLSIQKSCIGVISPRAIAYRILPSIHGEDENSAIAICYALVRGVAALFGLFMFPFSAFILDITGYHTIEETKMLPGRYMNRAK